MSKVKKVQIKKLSDQKLSQNQSLSKIAHSLNYCQSTEKPDLYSESPYGQKLSRMRSSSNLKDNVSSQTGYVSPGIHAKFSSSLKQKISLNANFMSNIKENRESQGKIPKKKLIIADRKSMDSQNMVLDGKIDKVFTSFKESMYSNESLKKLENYFEEVIMKDKIFSSPLRKIKLAYEDWINFRCVPTVENSRLRNEIMEFSKKLTEEIEENKRLHRKIQKFSKENVELGRSLEERENNCRTLQDHLLKITKIDINDIPQDKTSWKVLVCENKRYEEVFKGLKKKVKSLKKQEKKLMKLFWALKQKGYPVEEIYNGLDYKKSKLSSRKTGEELSEYESLNTDAPKSRTKPGIVPSLDMLKVQPNSFSESRSSDFDISISN